MLTYKFGRRPRKFDSKVPHWSALRHAAPALPSPPPAVDYTAGIPDIGMLGNDLWGCCAPAGAIHLLQLMQWNATKTMPKAGTAQCLQLYSEVTGFDINAGPPGNNPTDQGTVLQDLLTYWLKTGIPLADGTRHKILAYFEVDPLSVHDMNLGTAESAGLYTGWNVPAFVEQQESPGAVWDTGADTTIVGGHCTTSGRYLANGNREAESWGSTDYQMTPRFVSANMDEAYVVITPTFVETTNLTPFGISLDMWEQQMQAIKRAA
jgi:hypothetical protein